MAISKHIIGLTERYPALAPISQDIQRACDILIASAKSGKILLCGNGGSAADCSHISGELLKGFLLKRPLDEEALAAFEKKPDLGLKIQRGISAIPLPELTAASTAYLNDVDPSAVYAQLAYALGHEGDSLVCISTSGNAENVINAAIAAKAKKLSVVGLTGKTGGALAPLCDVCIKAPETETYKVQELHLPVYHILCIVMEEEIFA
jgi:D-sedoheptulose 7-phosphate isomerase